MPTSYHTNEQPAACGAEFCAVSEVMSTRLFTVNESESVLAAWEVLRRSGFHHLPVVTEGRRCSGVIDVATLATAYARTGLSLASSPVRELLVGEHRPRVTEDDTVRRAARIMMEGRTDALPVLDSHGTLVGLITASDLVALLANGAHHGHGVAGSPHRLGAKGTSEPSDYLPKDYSATRERQ